MKNKMKNQKKEYQFPNEIYALRFHAEFNSQDVAERLKKLPDETLKLLIDYYVDEIDAKILADKYNIDVSSFGGRLSVAKRALNKVLDGLISASGRCQEQKAKSSFPIDEETKLTFKRHKASRMALNRFRKKSKKDNVMKKDIPELSVVKETALYTVEEISAFIRADARTVRRYCVDKVFENAVKIGGKNWVIPGCDLLALCPFLKKN